MIDLAAPPLAAARRLCLLSNGNYSVMLSDNGAGFSRWRELAITRWREDTTRDDWGSHLLLRDEHTGVVWATSRQPIGATTHDVAVAFTHGRAEFVRREGSLTSALHVAVAPDADIELRRLTLTNQGDATRVLSMTSYTELVLGAVAADNAHPAFSKMFVQTSLEAQHGVLLATRRNRAKDEAGIWAAHALQIEGGLNDGGRREGRIRTVELCRCRSPPTSPEVWRRSVYGDYRGHLVGPVAESGRICRSAVDARSRNQRPFF